MSNKKAFYGLESYFLLLTAVVNQKKNGSQQMKISIKKAKIIFPYKVMKMICNNEVRMLTEAKNNKKSRKKN